MNDDDYIYRVRNTHFECLGDAIQYCEACIYADCVELRTSTGWVVLYRDGDVIRDRPGFGRLIPYTAPKSVR